MNSKLCDVYTKSISSLMLVIEAFHLVKAWKIGKRINVSQAVRTSTLDSKVLTFYARRPDKCKAYICVGEGPGRSW